MDNAHAQVMQVQHASLTPRVLHPGTSPMRCMWASLIQDQFERENTSQPCLGYITSSSIKVYKSWFTHLVHNTSTHHSLHQSLAEVFQHNIVYDNGYMCVPHPCIYGTRDPSPLLIR